MDTQIKILDPDQHLDTTSHNSEGLMWDSSREDYVAQALRLWSPWRTYFDENITRISEVSINLKEKYEWLSCYLWMPDECNVSDIDPNTILLNSRISAARLEVKDDLQLLIVKFYWLQVKEILGSGEFIFTVSDIKI